MLPRAAWKDVARLAVAVPPLAEQRRIVDLISHIDRVVEIHGRISGSQGVAGHLVRLRANVLASLLSGDREIPESYDKFLEGQGGRGAAAV